MATQLRSIDESWDEGEPATTADTPYTRRARYFDSGNAFALKYPPVPCHQFLPELRGEEEPALVVELGGVGAQEHPVPSTFPPLSSTLRHCTPLCPTVNHFRSMSPPDASALLDRSPARWGRLRSEPERGRIRNQTVIA